MQQHSGWGQPPPPSIMQQQQDEEMMLVVGSAAPASSSGGMDAAGPVASAALPAPLLVPGSGGDDALGQQAGQLQPDCMSWRPGAVFPGFGDGGARGDSSLASPTHLGASAALLQSPDHHHQQQHEQQHHQQHVLAAGGLAHLLAQPARERAPTSSPEPAGPPQPAPTGGSLAPVQPQQPQQQLLGFRAPAGPQQQQQQQQQQQGVAPCRTAALNLAHSSSLGAGGLKLPPPQQQQQQLSQAVQQQQRHAMFGGSTHPRHVPTVASPPSAAAAAATAAAGAREHHQLQPGSSTPAVGPALEAGASVQHQQQLSAFSGGAAESGAAHAVEHARQQQPEQPEAALTAAAAVAALAAGGPGAEELADLDLDVDLVDSSSGDDDDGDGPACLNCTAPLPLMLMQQEQQGQAQGLQSPLDDHVTAMTGLVQGPPPPPPQQQQPAGQCAAAAAAVVCHACGHAVVDDAALLAGVLPRHLAASADGSRRPFVAAGVPAPSSSSPSSSPAPPSSYRPVLAYDPLLQQHAPPAASSHPERPDRTAAIMGRLAATGLVGRCRQIGCRPATVSELAAVHDMQLIRQVQAATRQQQEEAAELAQEQQQQRQQHDTSSGGAGDRSGSGGGGAAHDSDMAGSPPPPAVQQSPAHHSSPNQQQQQPMMLGQPPPPPQPPSSAARVSHGAELGATRILDCYLGPSTYGCAAAAAGGAVDATLTVLRGEAPSGAAIIRPPGHHAEGGLAMGFCYFNNAAVAARAAQAAGASRVIILDWDVHHGNGTSAIFEADPSVLYMSLHRYDGGRFFPGTGHTCDVGAGPGAGATVNVAWEGPGPGDADYLAAFTRVLLPIAYEFAPDLVLVSAGFDAAAGDPLGGCRLTPAGYGHLTALLAPIAPLVLLLEGGYNLAATAACVEACVRVLCGEAPVRLAAPLVPTAAGLAAIAAAERVQAAYWRCLGSGGGGGAMSPPTPLSAAAAGAALTPTAMLMAAAAPPSSLPPFAGGPQQQHDPSGQQQQAAALSPRPNHPTHVYRTHSGSRQQQQQQQQPGWGSSGALAAGAPAAAAGSDMVALGEGGPVSPFTAPPCDGSPFVPRLNSITLPGDGFPAAQAQQQHLAAPLSPFQQPPPVLGLLHHHGPPPISPGLAVRMSTDDEQQGGGGVDGGGLPVPGGTDADLSPAAAPGGGGAWGPQQQQQQQQQPAGVLGDAAASGGDGALLAALRERLAAEGGASGEMPLTASFSLTTSL